MPLEARINCSNMGFSEFSFLLVLSETSSLAVQWAELKKRRILPFEQRVCKFLVIGLTNLEIYCDLVDMLASMFDFGRLAIRYKGIAKRIWLSKTRKLARNG